MHAAEQEPCVHVEIRGQLNGNLFFSFHCVDVGAGLRSSDVTVDAFTLNHVPGGWSIFLITKNISLSLSMQGKHLVSHVLKHKVNSDSGVVGLANK